MAESWQASLVSMLKLLTLHVHGLGTPAKCDLFIRDISLLSFDLILLQEQANEFSRNWAGKCYWSFGGARSASVGLLVSPSFQGSVTRFTFDSDGRVISALILTGSHQINIVNEYAPNTVSDWKALFQNLHTFFLFPFPYSAISTVSIACLTVYRLLTYLSRIRQCFSLLSLIVLLLMFGVGKTLVEFLLPGPMPVILRLHVLIVFLFPVFYFHLFKTAVLCRALFQITISFPCI